MTDYTCKRCGYTTKVKCNLINHLSRFKICSVQDGFDDVDCDILIKELQVKNTNTNPNIACPLCGRQFAFRSCKSRHLKTCKKQANEVITLKERIRDLEKLGHNLNSKRLDQTTELGHIYLVWTSEFAKTNENVYKIGRSIALGTRMCNYPKNSNLLSCGISSTVSETEKLLLDIFAKTFIHRKDVGREYFQGDVNHMRQIIHDNTLCGQSVLHIKPNNIIVQNEH